VASGNTLQTFTNRAASFPSSNFSTFDSRNAHLVLNFDHTTAESCYFEGVLPRNYSGGGITVGIQWMAATATSGNVVWGVSFERHQAGTDDLDSDSFAAEKTVTSAVPGTSGHVVYATIAFTDGAEIDSIAVGEHFRIKVRRVASDAADTMNADDAQLLSIEVRET
jgi:hypothetical protein